MELTKRELWLMEQSYRCGMDFTHKSGIKFEQWMADVVDDHGHTVNQYLAGSAPKPEDDKDGTA